MLIFARFDIDTASYCNVRFEFLYQSIVIGGFFTFEGSFDLISDPFWLIGVLYFSIMHI